MLLRLRERHRGIFTVVMLLGAFIWTLLVQAPGILPALAFMYGFFIFLGVIAFERFTKVIGGKYVPELFYISLTVPIVFNLGGHLVNTFGAYEIGEPMRAVRFWVMLEMWAVIYAYLCKMAEPMRKQVMQFPPTSPPASSPTEPPATQPDNSSKPSALRMVAVEL